MTITMTITNKDRKKWSIDNSCNKESSGSNNDINNNNNSSNHDGVSVIIKSFISSVVGLVG